MPLEIAALAALGTIAALVAWPALDAWRRRSASREASAVAALLTVFALELRREGRCLPLDASLFRRLTRLQRAVPEVVPLLLAPVLPGLDVTAYADSAQRLALRLKRRVAFERKMLARTASGLRRGTVAAAVPPAALLGLAALDVPLPANGLISLLVLEALGCWLLWRMVHVEL